MKRGTYAVLPVHVDIDLDTVQNIKFIFTQGLGKRLMFQYPSDRILLGDDGVFGLVWTQKQTFYFSHGPINMDTYIKLKDMETIPQTEILSFQLSPTLFMLKEVRTDDRS